mmetsp:Transcript_53704/g.85458  ORF Transcript_53704/g.85458 Transcript_53704/m.85458 type:complete len:488 (+) Transcript_53704:47-1510(+)|eukprot:CAMPEP_0169225756 /NCGR_PEP_ID=MMETSP1016-20121227/23372_1 /TAXON_ID=342587 /ORGANISM="Karlodinium micrum, Strain CCMP2283" /LENGTH=487 /DNA_ID=CAMNT_0009304293 /DNA_START=37 /DNA_END=1500 /DNA_ORIENTATION=+
MDAALESSADDPYEVERVSAWVKKHDFERIAVQFPDDLLADAPMMLSRLHRQLPGRKVFALGDSTYGSSSVDEVGAQHNGADCIVHVGPSDQQHTGAMPVIFVFGRHSLKTSVVCSAVKNLFVELAEHFEGDEPCSLVLICDVALHHALARMVQVLQDVASGFGELLLASPHLEARDATGDVVNSIPLFRHWRDYRFGLTPLSTAWWASLGPLSRAAASKLEPLRICGRKVQTLRRSSGEPRVGQDLVRLPARCGFLYIGAASSALERRVTLRHSHACPCWRLDPNSGVSTERLSSHQLLMQRYRYVESAKSAGTVGLLLCTTGAEHGNAVADRLETLLRRAGRRVYRFIVGRLTPEKLGNFPEVECFVSLAGPEHFPFSTKEFHRDIVSPFELEVALGVREWTGDYVIDLDEILTSPMPVGPPEESTLAVQTLGAGGRLCHFNTTMDSSVLLATVPGAGIESNGPALLTEGLHGMAGKYTAEPSSK